MLYFPKALCRLSVQAITSLRTGAEEIATFDAIPRSVQWTRNSFLEGDEAQIEFSTQRFPILPRNVRNALLSVFAADARGIGKDLTQSAIRFIGYVDEPEMNLSEDDGKITMKARDFTSLFLSMKRPPVSLVPSYSDRLDVALKRIIAAVPGGREIVPVLRGYSEWPMIRDGAPARLHGAKVPWKAEDTYWELIKRACDPVGLIPKIRLNELVVSNVQGHASYANDPPYLVLGRNIVEYREKKNLKRLREGIGIRAYNSTTHQYVTAIYPPEGDRAITKKLPAATAKKAPPLPLVAGTQDKRHWFNLPAVASQKQADERAKELFERRQFQEFEATIQLAHMRVESAAGTKGQFTRTDTQFDLTELSAGDRVILDIDPKTQALLKGQRTTKARIQLLLNQGYEEGAARLCVSIFEGGTAGPRLMYVKKAQHQVSEEGYRLTLDVLNKELG